MKTVTYKRNHLSTTGARKLVTKPRRKKTPLRKAGAMQQAVPRGRASRSITRPASPHRTGTSTDTIPKARRRAGPARKTTVLLTDDHAAVRQGLCALVDAQGQFEVIGQARNGREAVKMARKLRPDVILMDIAMPVLNGIEATRQILAANPAAKVLILSAHDDDEYIERVIAIGAAGFLAKQAPAKVLGNAIRDVANGNLFFSVAAVRRLARARKKNAPARSLEKAE